MANPGDKVKVITDSEEVEGIFIQKPELLGDETIIIKLENGYNIGVKKERVKDIQVLEPYKQAESAEKEMKTKEGLPTVSILSVGGTISSKVDYKTGGVYADYTAEDFVEMCPELYDIANIKAKKVLNIMSEDMNPSHWKEVAQIVHDELSHADGIVVTTGTDTLGYFAAALSFMLKPNKPVILTASQRSIDRGSSDAFLNLICSVKAAAEWDGKEVVTCMHGTSADDYCFLIKGTKVRKMSTSRRDAFRAVNDEPYAKVFVDNIEIVNDSYKKEQDIYLKNVFDENVALVYIYPGMKLEVFDLYKGYKGIILMGTGFGHIPQNLYPKVKELIDSGVFVGAASQCIYGRTSSTVYSPLREMEKMGVVFLEDMLAETAYVKLGWVIAKGGDVKEQMLDNYIGEINDRIPVDTPLE